MRYLPSCVCSYILVSLHTQILNFPVSYNSLNRHDHDSEKCSGVRSRVARRGWLLGWLEWNGFAMVTAGKGQGKEAFWQAVLSEHLLIKRPCEALSAAAGIYSHSSRM